MISVYVVTAAAVSVERHTTPGAAADAVGVESHGGSQSLSLSKTIFKKGGWR